MHKCNLPQWTLEVLRCPGSGRPLRLEACRLVDDSGQEAALIEQNVIRVLSVRGMSLLPVLFGYLNGRNLLSTDDVEHLPQINRLLADLAKTGTLRRCNLIIASPRSDLPRGG